MDNRIIEIQRNTKISDKNLIAWEIFARDSKDVTFMIGTMIEPSDINYKYIIKMAEKKYKKEISLLKKS